MKNDSGLEKLILRYSGAAAAVLGANGVQAQADTILIEVDSTLDKNGQYYNIDMDTNGVIDFRIKQIVDSTTSDISGVIIEGRGPASNAVLGLDYGGYNYPFRLNIGDTISAAQPFKGIGANSREGYLGLIVGSTTYPNSQFTGGVVDGFLGVRFEGQIDSNQVTFYGWIRVDVAADLKSMKIKDHAYVTVPDSMIRAGFGSPIGVDEFEVEKPEISQRGLYLDINLPESFIPEASIEFYDISGKLVETTSVYELKSSLDLSQLPKGVLIVHVTSNGVEASRRIVIY